MIAFYLATPDHLSVARDIINDCKMTLASDRIFQWDENYPSNDLLLAYIREKSLYIASVDGYDAGLVVIDKKRPEAYGFLPFAYNGQAAYIKIVGVKREHRARGVAREALLYCEKIAQEQRCGALRLDIYINNNVMISLCESLQYHEVGRIRYAGKPLSFLCFEKLIALPVLDPQEKD